MKRHILLIATCLCSLSLLAENYTIVFNSGNADATNTSAELTNFILSATNNCISDLGYTLKLNRAKEGFGIKGGTSGEKGIASFILDDTYHITTMTVYAAPFVSANGTADNKKITVCGQQILWDTEHLTEIYPYSITLNQDIDSIFISSSVKSGNRWYVQKIEFEAEDPHPTQAIMEMQYPMMDFGSVKWESADEPMEDVLSFSLAGKHINGTISLSFKNSNNIFTFSENTLPAEGGEVDIFYSITMSDITKAIPINNVVVAKATGLDGIERTRELSIQLTIVPPSSGVNTFNLDTTRMVIGPMPGNYYQYAQNTTDSTLKNHLGYIICSGKRYRYGSGTHKTWDAFWFTDRDTLTNQVLDMYSNNLRYFNPASPAASVSGFDIEHMLPKSWWGGDVNPAYCDLYHLVPGDYSANRSKSNHAPGIPADSTFNNGSFVTGSGAAYGLTRVFCPADEYKGDFARAYFYIATCYGDSLEWLSTGEPGVAMTNEGWQEFQPWLRDLLVSWHRMDPVSEKEKARAIEVNKIQGNRNPFIDYPDLVEYIWGNKQGATVDFNALPQSYGDNYSDTPTAIPFLDSAQPAAHKELRDGQVVIIRNASIFSTLGQEIR